MKLTKRQLKRIIREEKAKVLKESILDPMDESSVSAVCRESLEFDTLVKVQNVIEEFAPDCDLGGEADVHIATVMNGMELSFEDLTAVVHDWMVSYANACAENSSYQ